MKIPSISKLQWHAFSITSSSAVNDQTVSLMIKCEGWWTNSLYNMINSEPDTVSSNMKCIPVAIEGPYGPPSMDFLRWEQHSYWFKIKPHVRNLLCTMENICFQK